MRRAMMRGTGVTKSGGFFPFKLYSTDAEKLCLFVDLLGKDGLRQEWTDAQNRWGLWLVGLGCAFL